MGECISFPLRSTSTLKREGNYTMSVLYIKNITKEFPGTVALNNVTCEFVSGKVNALVGKNGSGKSTLLKIINGALQPTSGQILLDDINVKNSSPKDAQNMGISTVFQELSLIPGLTVAENILMNRFSMKGKLIDWKKTFKEAKDILDKIGIDINPKEVVANLSMWQCQMIEIAKAMSCNPKVLLLDEPTSSLSQNETEMLFNLVRELKKNKEVTIIYITHRLQELWEIADTCTVLRDGMYTGKLDMSTATHKELLGLMFGETEIKQKPSDLKYKDKVVLEVKDLTRKHKFNNINFKLREGEILGIAGMLGSGRTELLRSIFGADKFDSGEVYINDNKVKRFTTEKVKELGLGLTPEDRKTEGLVQVASIKNNLCNASLKKLTKGWFMDKKKENEFAEKQVDYLMIKTAGLDIPVKSLSGGNQQKVVIGNWLNTSPKVMLFDEPSRGIDVNAKMQIFQIIWDLSRMGISSIVVSSELEELLEICHRVMIMKSGQIKGEVMTDEVNIEELYSLCMGGNEK